MKQIQTNNNSAATVKTAKNINFKETAVKFVFAAAACVSILAVVLICVFIFVKGFPAIAEIGPIKFFTGKVWKPDWYNAGAVEAGDAFGILPMIIGSVYATAGAIIIGVPIGVLTAIFMARFCPKVLYKFIKPCVELLAGIPSVVYGFLGLQLLVPFIQSLFTEQASGKSILATSILLGVMILPTIINVSESALRAVPENYYEGSLALGATHERSVFFVLTPAAKSGILASVILGVGRAIGETMAVIWVAGNSTIIPKSPLDGVRTLTSNIVIEMGYATGLHKDALIATAVALFVFILIINLCFSMIKRRSNI